MTDMSGQVIKILSIDGGVIRGLIPALILEELERRLIAISKKRPFATIFDLVAGTSTGALIALGLVLLQADNAVSRGLGHGSVPVLSLGDIIDFYTKRGPEVFFPMRNAARASSAAPAFSPPALISPLPERGERFSLIDGAIFANNPSLLAYIEAKKIFPEAKDFLILSLSAGDDTAGFPYTEIEKWGFIEWVNPLKRMPLLSMISAGQSESVNHMLKRIAGLCYFCFSGPLEVANPAIDDSSQLNIAALRDTARHIIDDYEEHIELLCEAW